MPPAVLPAGCGAVTDPGRTSKLGRGDALGDAMMAGVRQAFRRHDHVLNATIGDLTKRLNGSRPSPLHPGPRPDCCVL